MKVKYVTQDVLLRVREFEKKHKFHFNQMFTDDAITKVGSTKLPIVFEMLHNEDHMRVVVVVDPNAAHGKYGLVDMPFEIYKSLPETEVEDASGGLHRQDVY